MQGQRINLLKVTISKILKHGTSLFITAFALLGLFIIINYIFAVKTNYIDLTKNRINSLTENTKSFLGEIDFPINIKAFYLSASQARMLMILNGYRLVNDNITFELIDPLKSPILAQEYDIIEPGTLIFEAEGKTARLGPSPRVVYQSEREITLMLYQLLTNETHTAYFTEGHGELSIMNPNQDGLSRVRDRLIEQGYLVESLNLQTVETISVENSIVVIAEPKTPYSLEELNILFAYLENGGNIMILGSPDTEPTETVNNISELLIWHGLQFGDNFVYETASNKTTNFGPIAPLCNPHEFSEIITGLENQNILFPFVRSVELVYEKDETEYIRLMSSSESSWAETDLESAREIQSGSRPTRAENEMRGPIIVAFTTETLVSIPDSVRAGYYRQAESRSAFFGNTRFASNGIVAQFPSNLSLFLNTINWITKNEKIINITPNANVFTPVELLRSQRKLINWITMLLYPSLIILTGVVIWFRKR